MLVSFLLSPVAREISSTRSAFVILTLSQLRVREERLSTN
jgi:hypothetical protein